MRVLGSTTATPNRVAKKKELETRNFVKPSSGVEPETPSLSEVGDHSVAERTDRADRRRSAPDHPASILTNRLNSVCAFVDRDDRRLEDDDPLATNEHERVRRAKVDRQLPTADEPPKDHRDPTETVVARLTRRQSSTATASTPAARRHRPAPSRLDDCERERPVIGFTNSTGGEEPTARIKPTPFAGSFSLSGSSNEHRKYTLARSLTKPMSVRGRLLQGRKPLVSPGIGEWPPIGSARLFAMSQRRWPPGRVHGGSR
jgi:hypothetical protein